MKKLLDKNKFYEQLKMFTNKHIPIFIQMPINNESKYSIVLDENRVSGRNLNHNYTLQIFDRTISGYEKYICKDISFNLIDENIKSDYQLYKFINSKLKDLLKEE